MAKAVLGLCDDMNDFCDTACSVAPFGGLIKGMMMGDEVDSCVDASVGTTMMDNSDGP